MTPDVKEDNEALKEIELEEDDPWSLYFNPKIYVKERGKLKLTDFQMTKDQLQ